MPPCNKEILLRPAKNSGGFYVNCCESEGHEGEHEAHIWTSASNKATKEQGLIKIIKWE